MNKAKNRTATTIGFMLLFAIIVLMFYYYWTNRTQPLEENSQEELTEYEKLMGLDLEENYPETPRETVKLFARMEKVLYDNATDDQVKELAKKLRGLYDEELLNNNPEGTYLTELYSELAAWKDKERRITNYLLVNEDLVTEEVIEGVKYSVQYVSFTIQEGGKFTETWRVLLRQDQNKDWKILGWEAAQVKEQ